MNLPGEIPVICLFLMEDDMVLKKNKENILSDMQCNHPEMLVSLKSLN